MAIAIVSRRTSRSPSEAAYSGDASDIKLDYIEASGGIVMSETMDSDWTFSAERYPSKLTKGSADSDVHDEDVPATLRQLGSYYLDKPAW